MSEGERLTSMIQGRRSASIKISKPNTSKQLVRWATDFFIAGRNRWSTLIIALMMTS